MTNFRGITHLATAAILLAAMAACVGDRGDAEPGSSPGPTSTASAPAPSTPASDQEVASEAASRLVRTYYAVRDNLRQDPKASLDELTSIATSTELSAQQSLFKRERKDGLYQIGNTKISTLTVQTVNLDNSNPKAGKVPTVQVDVCYDVSGVDVLDRNGHSVVSPDRADTGWIRYSVANYKWTSDPTGAWRVATSENIERAPCAAS